VVGQNQNDTELKLEAHHCQWAVRYMSGDLRTALEHCDQGIRLYRPDAHHALTFTYGGHDPGVCARHVSGFVFWLLGYPEQSQQRFDAAFSLAKELDHSTTSATVLRIFLLICSLRRDLDLLDQTAKKLFKFAEQEKMPEDLILARGLIGWVDFQRGNRQKGLKLMRESADRWIEAGNSWTAVPISLVAESLAQIGEVEEALSIMENTISLGQRNDVHLCEAELYRVKGNLLLGKSTQAAEDAFSRAIKIAVEQNAKLLELRATVSLTQLWQTGGKTDQARELLCPIYDWFTEGLDSTDLVQAKALLKELT
jgi:predicted ATPase